MSVSSKAMLVYISRQRHQQRELGPALRAILWRPKFKGIQGEKKFVSFGELFTEMYEAEGKVAVFSNGQSVPTESNVNYRVFQGFMLTFGIDETRYVGDKIKIERLIGLRNNIAHGEKVEVDSGEVRSAVRHLTALMRRWQEDLVDSAASKSYKA